MIDRNFDGKTLLVTGGAGFIGSNFIRHVLGRHPGVRVINLDKLTYAGNLENLRDVEADPRYEFVHGDIRDRDLVARLFPRVQGVVHFAAETHVDRSIVDAGEFVLTDVYGSFVLFEALKDVAARRVLRPHLDRRGLRQPRRGLLPRDRPARARPRPTPRARPGPTAWPMPTT